MVRRKPTVRDEDITARPHEPLPTDIEQARRDPMHPENLLGRAWVNGPPSWQVEYGRRRR